MRVEFHLAGNLFVDHGDPRAVIFSRELYRDQSIAVLCHKRAPGEDEFPRFVDDLVFAFVRPELTFDNHVDAKFAARSWVEPDFAEMKPLFGVIGLFSGALALLLTVHRYFQRAVPAGFYDAISSSIGAIEETAPKEDVAHLPKREVGERYAAWLARLDQLLEHSSSNAYRETARLQPSDLTRALAEGSEDEKLAAAWLLRKARVDVSEDEPVQLARIRELEEAYAAEEYMLSLEPGALHASKKS